MLAQEIKKRVNAETIGMYESARGWHFREHILPEPMRAELKDHAGKPYQVWVVLIEPGNGYSVIFDDTDLEFGLATSGVVIGMHGGFMDALNAM